ncbi:MAG: hypothetical protein J5626_01240 [Lachnospiraceae bacterium]|nr:hypothetical protein [Lachnospiraceae bacterium]
MKTLKTIGQFLCVNIKEIFSYLAAPAGGGAVGILLAVAIIKTVSSSEKPASYGTIGTILAVVMAVAVLLFGQSMGGQSDFYVTVSMNRARMPYLIGRYILVIIDILGALGVTLLVNFLERKVIGPAVSVSGEVENILHVRPEVIVALVFIVPLITIFCTAMYVLFERKFFWAMWGIYMLCAIGIPRISTAMDKHPGSFAAKIGEGFSALGNMGVGPWAVIGVVVSAALLVANVLLYKKMEVKL